MKSQTRQVAALPIRRGQDGIEVLLVTSRETGRWVIPKGWRSAKLTDWDAARREARQEAGVRGEIGPEVIGNYTYLKRLPDCHRFITVDVYLMVVGKEADKWPEAAQRRRAWFPMLEAARQVREPGLKRLMSAFAALPYTAPMKAIKKEGDKPRRKRKKAKIKAKLKSAGKRR
jgi:8-oxo-dGTP pyrophosphatase MutT (NUDIX family)